ncbi:MAG: hypothetical protein QOI42_1196, partial [Frankiaceae bacterium]|nr:hypothetical protein [Frankiaceae bacterium]
MPQQVTRPVRRLVCVLALRRTARACVLAAGLACAPTALAAGPPQFHDGAGLHIVSVKQVNPRLTALTVTTRALPAPANVYLLLPPDYATSPHRRWPVFYLLHGTSGRASDWTAHGAQKVIGDREVITVMPDIDLNGDGGGWCTDWPNGGQRWETFHIGQLIPWVDTNLRTKRARQKRAIAGLSQGGFCSLSYAARHPDLFGVALGYSGAPDIYYDPEARVGAGLIIGATELGLTHVAPATFFGDPLTNGINWAAHDPASIAENLRSTRMYMYWGNGLPGPLDPDPVAPLAGASEIEGAVNQSNVDFQRRLDALRIPAFFDPYGAGTHIWPYWMRDLQWSIDRIMSDFAHPASTPRPFTYTSADDQYGVYRWRVATHRAAREFSTLAGATCRSFSLSGSGAATVTTPACLKRRKRYVVTMTGPGASSSAVLRVGRNRRLVLTVPLGPSNAYQQDTPQAQAAGTRVYTTRVTIVRAPSRRSA